jgi:hypothetical protein
MNYLQPRQRKNEDGTLGKWHMTNKHDDDVYPVGYCADGCPGHDTPDEAREHFRAYLLDSTDYDTRHRWGSPRRCEVCGKFTTRFVQTAWEHVHTLCPAHANRDGLAAVLVVGDMVTS